MEQGINKYENAELPIPYSDVDYVLVTHAHIDHVGLLPLIYARGFRGQIMATRATCDLCDIMLKDCAHIQESEAEWKNRKAMRAGKPEVTPIYTMNDAEGVLHHFVPCNYNEIIRLNDNLEIRFVDVGHLLGSASIEIWMKEDDCSKVISVTKTSHSFAARSTSVRRIMLSWRALTAVGSTRIQAITWKNLPA